MRKRHLLYISYIFVIGLLFIISRQFAPAQAAPVVLRLHDELTTGLTSCSMEAGNTFNLRQLGIDSPLVVKEVRFYAQSFDTEAAPVTVNIYADDNMATVNGAELLAVSEPVMVGGSSPALYTVAFPDVAVNAPFIHVTVRFTGATVINASTTGHPGGRSFTSVCDEFGVENLRYKVVEDSWRLGIELVVVPVVTDETAVMPEITAEITSEITPEVTPESTVEVTPEVTVEATSEVTPEVTAIVTPEITPEVTVVITPDETAIATPEITSEATVVVTPEETPVATDTVIPEVTAIITPDVTPEETPVVTPETPEATAIVTPEETPVATEAVTLEVTTIVTPEETFVSTEEITPDATEETPIATDEATPEDTPTSTEAAPPGGTDDVAPEVTDDA